MFGRHHQYEYAQLAESYPYSQSPHGHSHAQAFMGHHPDPNHARSIPFMSGNAVASHTDHFYGHKDMAELCDRVVSSMFLGNRGGQIPAPSISGDPIPSLSQYIAYVVHRTRAHPDVAWSALFLLSFLKSRLPKIIGESGHRLFLVAFMIAHKFIEDDSYSQKSWVAVSRGMFHREDINTMEREMCAHIEWQLNINRDSLYHFKRMVIVKYAENGPCPAFIHPQGSYSLNDLFATGVTNLELKSRALTMHPQADFGEGPKDNTTFSAGSENGHSPTLSTPTGRSSSVQPKSKRGRDPSFAFPSSSRW